MFIIKIADLNIAIDNKYDYVFEQCTEYICSENHFDFIVSVTEDELLDEQKNGEYIFDPAYLESICIYRNIAKELHNYSAFVMHGAAIKFEGNAYCFTAKSGTGKTTHINLLKQLLGEDLTIINGDKPIIRFLNDKFVVFGTPWCGKECLGNNVSAPLRGIYFLEQNAENSISPCIQHEALNKLLQQIFLSADDKIITTTISLIDNLIKNTTMWCLKCNISLDAAMLSHKTMLGKV